MRYAIALLLLAACGSEQEAADAGFVLPDGGFAVGGSCSSQFFACAYDVVDGGEQVPSECRDGGVEKIASCPDEFACSVYVGGNVYAPLLVGCGKVIRPGTVEWPSIAYGHVGDSCDAVLNLKPFQYCNALNPKQTLFCTQGDFTATPDASMRSAEYESHNCGP